MGGGEPSWDSKTWGSKSAWRKWLTYRIVSMVAIVAVGVLAADLPTWRAFALMGCVIVLCIAWINITLEESYERFSRWRR